MGANGSSSIAERARTEMSEEDQVSLFDRVIEGNNVLENALAARAKKAADKRTATANFKNADQRAKALIEELDLEVDEVVRVGRFKIKKGRVEGGTPVSFETAPREQLYISEIK